MAAFKINMALAMLMQAAQILICFVYCPLETGTWNAEKEKCQMLFLFHA